MASPFVDLACNIQHTTQHESTKGLQVATDIQTIDLKPAEQALVESYAETGDWYTSACGLGYSRAEAKALEKAASKSPAMLAGVYVAVGRRLVEGAAVGLKVLLDIARSEQESTAGKKLQLEAAKELLKLGGHVGPRAKATENQGSKQLHEMSLDDLKRTRDALESAIADRSAPVIAPDMSRNDSEDLDLIGD